MNESDKSQFKEAYQLLKNHSWEQLEAFIIDYPKVLQIVSPLGTLLHSACRECEVEQIKFFVEKGAEVNAREGIAGGTALNLATSEGKIEVMEYLLDQGAEMDTDEPERNPLFAAIHKGYAGCARLLIERGIDTSVRYTGETMKNMGAREFAEEWGRTDIIELLDRNESNQSR